MRENRFKARLKAGEVQKGLWLASGSPLLAELGGRSGFDWCLVDGEHGPNTLETVQAQLIALEGTPSPGLVRVRENDHGRIKPLLDIGCQTIMVPMVHSAEEAARAVAATRYPPKGTRGHGAAVGRASDFGRMADYAARSDAEMCVMVQIESPEAVANAAEIAAVEGVDCLFIGPADLAADLGADGPDAPEMIEAITSVFDAAKEAGKAGGILWLDERRAREAETQGATVIATCVDTVTLAATLAEVARR